jgi:DNA repair protein RAD16
VDASLQESEGNESEYEGSQTDDSESEALMVTAAIQQSLATLQDDNNGASSSKAAKLQQTVSKTIQRKARRAEKRITRGSAATEGVEVMSEYSEPEIPFNSSSDEDGEGSSSEDTRPPRAPRRSASRGGRGARKPKLTHVSGEFLLEHRFDVSQAEKTTIALHQHHPELRDVWGDLEKTLPTIKPECAEQPANLKVSLLPFQQESLFWMRKQENTEWKGGILADEMG